MAVSALVTPVYTASAGVLLTVNSGDTAGELNQGSTYAENQVRSYAQVLTAPVVLQPVIDKLGLGVTIEKLAQRVTATVPLNTAIVNIDVTGTDAAQTADIANAVARQLTVVDELSPQTESGARTVKATIITPASVPLEWTSPRVLLNLALGALLGLLPGAGQAIRRFRLDTRVFGEADVAQVTDRSIVGAIVFDTDAKDHPLIFQADPHSRLLRAGLGKTVEVGSAGVEALFGSPIDPPMARFLEARHAESTGFAARQVDAHLLADAALVRTLARAPRAQVLKLATSAVRRTFPLLEFVRVLESLDLSGLPANLSPGADSE